MGLGLDAAAVHMGCLRGQGRTRLKVAGPAHGGYFHAVTTAENMEMWAAHAGYIHAVGPSRLESSGCVMVATVGGMEVGAALGGFFRAAVASHF